MALSHDTGNFGSLARILPKSAKAFKRPKA